MSEADPARLAAGWERRFVAEPRRAEEAAALYAALGFEVALDELRETELPSACTDCRLPMMLSFKTLYTRKPPERTR